jgi:crossover junction endodeoxyribonuclease RuvC
MTRRILGIDPGSHRLGVGVVDVSGNKVKLIHTEVLVAPKDKSLFNRMTALGTQLESIIQQFSPMEVAVEDIFYARNVKSAITLGTARGAVIGMCLQKGFPIFEYAATQVKSVVTGSGRADKVQIQKMVQLVLGVRFEIGFDATDALAVAICHASHKKVIPC